MITAKLINPQVYYKNGAPDSFDNTLILSDENGVELDRRTINLPYAMPDPEIEDMVKMMAVDYAASLEIEQSPQEILQWDWVSEA